MIIDTRSAAMELVPLVFTEFSEVSQGEKIF